MKQFFSDFFHILMILFCVFCFIFAVLLIIFFYSFKEEDNNSDAKSVNSASSSQSKEKRKNYLTRMNTLINGFMSEKIPELNMEKYTKIQNEYRNQFKKNIMQNIRNYSLRRSFSKKRVSFQKEIEEEEQEFII